MYRTRKERLLPALFWAAFICLMLFAGREPKIGGPIFLVVIFVMMGWDAERERFSNILLMIGGFVAIAIITLALVLIVNGGTL